MTTADTDQGITLQVGGDPANLPSAQLAEFSGVLSRLNLRYLSVADRTARHPVSVKGEESYVLAEDRTDIFDGANWVSRFPRTNTVYARRTTDTAVISANTTLANDSVLLAAVPTTGTFDWETLVYYDSSQIADLKIAYTWPAGATAKWGFVAGLATGAAGTTGDTQCAVTTVSGTSAAIGGAAVGTITTAMIRGTIVMGGTAGTLNHQAAQNSSDPTNTTVSRIGSSLRLWQVS